MSHVHPEKIEALLLRGRELLHRGQARDAALVLRKVVGLAPGDATAQGVLASAEAAVVESERVSDERVAAAAAALDAGRRDEARSILEDLLAAGGDAGRALQLLDRLDERGGRLQTSGLDAATVAAVPVEDEPRHATTASRPVFAACCLAVFSLLGAGVTSQWDAFLARLARAPVPDSPPISTAAVSAPTAGDRAVSDARRLMEAGDAAGALSVLDAISPREPAYPFARQLRSQAERVLRDGAQGAPAAVHSPREARPPR